jgi:ABC-type lipoprotein export system ATPase subunit
MLSFHDVTVRLGGRTLLKGCSFAIAPEECVCITGPSGSGKTTMLNLLIGATPATAGKISIDDIPLASMPPEALQLYRSSLGVVFQSNQLLSAATVIENMCMQQEFQGKERDSAEREAKALLERLDLWNVHSALPAWLSPGQQKLLSIARAFMGSPLILLADEPLSGLDMEQTSLALEMLREAQIQRKTLILFSAHPEQFSILHPRIINLLQAPTATQRSQSHSPPNQATENMKPLVHHPARVKITALGG